VIDQRIHFRSVWGAEDGVQVQCQLGEEQRGALLRISLSLSPLFIDLDILVSQVKASESHSP